MNLCKSDGGQPRLRVKGRIGFSAGHNRNHGNATRQIDDPWDAKEALLGLGLVTMCINDLDRLRAIYEEALPLARGLKDKAGEALAVQRLAMTELYAAQHARISCAESACSRTGSERQGAGSFLERD